MEKIKLIDTIGNLQTFIREYSPDEFPQGIFMIFEKLQHDETDKLLPWLDEELAYALDMEYYLHHSGDKEISTMYRRYLSIESENPTSNGVKDLLMKVITNKFALSWNKIYDAIVTEYAPLENYDMEQTETPNVTKTKTVKQKLTTANKVYGFNSDVAVPQSESTSEGAKLDNEEQEQETGTRGLTRHGNIGVTTSQQMLNSEIDLRKNFNFMNQIMNDVDSILCLLVY